MGPTAALRQRVGKRVWLLVAAAFVMMAFLAAAPAFACAPVTKASAEPSQGAAGSEITVRGTGFSNEGGSVEVRWGGSSGQLLATAEVNESGNFSTAVTVPDAEPGTYWLQAKQGSTTANFEFEVAGTPAGEDQPAAEEPPPAEEEPAAEEPAGDELPSAQEEQGSAEVPEGGFEPAASGEEPAQQDQESAQQPQQTDGQQPAPDPAPQEPAQQPAPAAPEPTDDGAQQTQPSDTVSGQQQQEEPASEPSAADQEPAEEGEDASEPALVGTGSPLTADTKALLAGAAESESEPAMPSDATAGAVEAPEVSGDFGEGRSVNGGPSAWILAPLALLGLGVFIVGGASFVHELRHRTERVKI